MKKICICFSGELRNIDESIEYWLEIKNKYNADIYGSFWYTDNEYHKELFKTKLNPIKIEYENFNLFKKTTIDIYNEEINVPSEINETERIHNSKSEYVSMWYKVWRCNLLSNITNYDIVIRSRTDIKIENLKINYNDYITIPSIFIGIWDYKNCEGPTDIFAYGNQKIMNYYSSIYLYITRYLKEGYYMHPVENILRVHLSNRNLTVNYIDLKIYLYKYKEYLYQHNPEYLLQSKEFDVEPEPKYTFYKKYDSVIKYK